MAANRIAEGTQPGDEPATAEADAAQGAPGGFKAWLPLIATIAFMPVLAYAMTTFVLVPKLKKSLGVSPAATAAAETGAADKTPAAAGPRASVAMNKLLVNVAGTMGSRYLLVSLSVVGTDPNFEQKMKDDDPQLRDMACSDLATKTIADLEKPSARNEIRSELIAGFNNILGGSMVKDIYLTEFAIQ